MDGQHTSAGEWHAELDALEYLPLLGGSEVLIYH